MQAINSRISIVGATHELRTRLKSNTKTNWDSLKAIVEKSSGRIYSDSAFLSHLIDDVLTPSAAANLK